MIVIDYHLHKLTTVYPDGSCQSLEWYDCETSIHGEVVFDNKDTAWFVYGQPVKNKEEFDRFLKIKAFL